MRTVLLAVGFAISGACGPSAPGVDGGPSQSGDGGPGTTADGGFMAPDLEGGTWQLQNVSQTPTTMGFHARQALLAGGERHVAWAEVDPEQTSDMDIFAASRAQGSWSQAPPLTDDENQHTYTSMVSDGDKIYVAWSGRESSLDDHDIYLAVYEGGAWGLPRDLTTGLETEEVREDYRPSLALSPDGELAIAYLSGLDLISVDVRVVRIRGGDVGAPVTVISSADLACSQAVVAVAPNTSAHLIARCTDGLQYATDETGPWSDQPLEQVRSLTELSPDVAVDASGVHLVFRGDVVCGDSSCGEIFYAHRPLGGTFAPAINVSASESVTDILPVVAVDRAGRVLVAYKALGEEDDEGFFTYSEDGESFSTPVNLAPESPDTNEEPTDIGVDPTTGLPSVTLQRTFIGSDPLNIDTFVADFIPPGQDPPPY